MNPRAASDSYGGEHPPIEDLAALVESRIPPAEAARLRSHLARCERCLTIVAETAQFLEEDGEETIAAATAAFPPVPHRTSWGGRRWSVPLAAALLLAAGLAGYRTLLDRSTIDMARLAVAVAGRTAAITAAFWGPTLRGPVHGTGEFSTRSFRLGVELANLEMGLRIGDSGHASAAAARIYGLMAKGAPPARAAEFFSRLPTRIASVKPLGPLADEVAVARGSLAGYVSPPLLELGRWVEASRFAAAAADPTFLTAWSTRHSLRHLRQTADALPPRVSASLSEIQAILDSGNLGAEEYRTLSRLLKGILDVYYPY